MITQTLTKQLQEWFQHLIIIPTTDHILITHSNNYIIIIHNNTTIELHTRIYKTNENTLNSDYTTTIIDLTHPNSLDTLKNIIDHWNAQTLKIRESHQPP